MKSILFLFGFFLVTTKAIAGSGPVEPVSASLRILSYNIKMLPRIVKREHHAPVKRARMIPAHLEEENPDVIVLQEAFDSKANRIMHRSLRNRYPYMIGPVNKKAGFKINGGVVIYSKYPLKKLGEVQYSQCEDFDCWARKGALLVEVNDGHHIYQVAGTHLNGGGSLELKTSQYREMGELMKRFSRTGVPQFAVGDYNTSNFDTAYYQSMLHQLDAEDGPVTGELFCTNDHLNNDMERYDPKEQNIIDYILYRPNGVKPQKMQRIIRSYCQRWSKEHEDLSDHYALLMELKW
jgi:exonuclease III